MIRLEEADPGLLPRIRALAKKGYSRTEIFNALHSEGRMNNLVSLRKIIHRCNITIRYAKAMAPDQQRELAMATAALAREIAEARANPASEPYKSGRDWYEW
jgi:hypothetical protein